jgi:hypothetical protein
LERVVMQQVGHDDGARLDGRLAARRTRRRHRLELGAVHAEDGKPAVKSRKIRPRRHVAQQARDRARCEDVGPIVAAPVPERDALRSFTVDHDVVLVHHPVDYD